jgi:hypothetical protein
LIGCLGGATKTVPAVRIALIKVLMPDDLPKLSAEQRPG